MSSKDSQVSLSSQGSLSEGEILIGDYRVQLADDIGSGSFGAVYEANHRRTQELVAVKKIKFTFQKEVNQEMRDMAKTEAESMRMIEHPNIVSLLDYTTHRGSAWLFMPYCELGDMSRYLKSNPDLPIGQRFIMMHQMAKAIHHLHHNAPPIIHRDIKPGNVLVKRINSEDRVMLTDFGFAKLYDHNMSMKGSIVYRNFQESLKGTPSYMAPEFFMEDPSGLKYTATVDIFSLGLMYSIIIEYSSDNTNLQPMSVKAKKEDKVVNFGFEMSECFKRSDPLPCITQHEPTDIPDMYDMKELMLQMTAFHDHDRIHIGAVTEKLSQLLSPKGNSLDKTKGSLLDLVTGKLYQAKTAKSSHVPWSIRLIGSELWSCQNDGIAVYNTSLEFLSHMKLPWTRDAVLLPNGNAVIVGLNGLTEISTTGDVIKTISTSSYTGIAVHGNRCYACPTKSSKIDVYLCRDWSYWRFINLPGCTDKCQRHTLSVTDEGIKVCCWDMNTLIILSADGVFKSKHGPEIEVIEGPREHAMSTNGVTDGDATEIFSDGTTNQREVCKSELNGPHMCQEDNKGNVFIADCYNNSLLMFTSECKFLHAKAAYGEFNRWPKGALLLNERLYVSSFRDESITLFE